MFSSKLIALFLVLTTAFASNLASAHDDHKIKATIEGAWARETTASARNGAAYLTLKYLGEEKAVLTGAATDRAMMVMLHNTVEEDGVARMREAGDITLDPGAEIVFQPGGRHFMLMGLKEPLVKGQIFRLTLKFKDHDDLVIPVKVAPATGPVD